jgi:hypothetical protein
MREPFLCTSSRTSITALGSKLGVRCTMPSHAEARFTDLWPSTPS